jgi:hypothetical protein
MESEELWDLMGEMPVPEPSENMQLRFDAMLEDFKASVGNKRVLTLRPALAVACSLFLVAAGLGLGLFIHRNIPAPATPPVAQQAPASDQQQLAALTTQVHEMREMVMLSLLQNPSASERMRGVSYTEDIKNVNPNIAEALLATLNSDPNVNVRLTTLEALTHFANNPAVREGLIHSILQQESPLVQAALADVMLKLQEKRAVRPFRKLLQQKDLNKLVKTKIEQTITRLT